RSAFRSSASSGNWTTLSSPLSVVDAMTYSSFVPGRRPGLPFCSVSPGSEAPALPAGFSSFLAHMVVALDRSVASLHRTLHGPGLEVGLRLLHELLPVALGLSGDANDVQPRPHFRRASPLRAQPGIGRSADLVSRAELRDSVSNPL